ncbi:MAG: hypothetical protein ACYSWQ_19710 [Planctomycetota bacterium]|jgi:hypothetical protein
MLISEVIKRNREGPNLPLPRWLYMEWAQQEMIRFAEKVDRNLARKMKQLTLVLFIALGGNFGFAILMVIIGCFVWG